MEVLINFVVVYLYLIITFDPLNLYNVTCQLSVSKAGGWGEALYGRLAICIAHSLL